MALNHKRGRPKNEEVTTALEITGTEPKLIAYLEDLKQMQGFGNSLSAIARTFIWKEVNRLIEAGRLHPR